ncbi:MAG: hypothetical protein K1X74_22885 [Pirellulales bacterium]|nr:hypothetical protein [Pirellulales bacterium]
MDFLNQAMAQLTELFRSMTPAARVISVLLLAVVIASVGFLVNTGVAGPDAYLLSGRSFSPDELEKVEAALGAAGLSNYTVEGTKVLVPRGQQASYLAALAENNALPRNFGDHLRDAMNAGGPLASRHDQQERLKIARQTEIAQIISNMSGISKAAVLYDTKSRGMLKRDEVITASVHIEASDPGSLDDARIRAIRHLVAGSIAGLAPDGVTVTDASGRTWAGGSPASGGSSMDDAYMSRWRDYQKEYETKVLAALSYVPGVTVAVDVELDREVESTLDQVKVDPKAVAVRTEKETLNNTNHSANSAGRPGFQAQQPNQGAALANAAAPGPASVEKTTRNEEDLTTGHDRMHSRKVGLVPKRVAFAVGIPSGYLAKIWSEQNPPAAGQEPAKPDAAALAKIEEKVVTDIKAHLATMVVAPPETTDLKSLVTVTTFQQLAPTEIAGPTTASTALAWLSEYGSTAAMLGLGLFALMMLRSTIRGVPAASSANASSAGAASAPNIIAATVPAGEAEMAGGAGGEPAPRENRLARRREGGPSIREELTEIVKEDPASAANILQAWISSAI